MATKELSFDEVEDAKRLKKVWTEKKDELHLNQVKAAKELGYNSQGAVSQYLNGKVAMNMQTAAKFAQLLRVEIAQISPRFSKMVGKPIAPVLDNYVPPETSDFPGALNWFAWSKEFAEYLNVDPSKLRLVRSEDDSSKEFPVGSVFLVDSSKCTEPESGIYFLQQSDKMIVRRLEVATDVVIVNGRQRNVVARDAFALLRIAGKAISVFTPVSK